MDRGTWQAVVQGVTRVGHDLVSKPPLGTLKDPACLVADKASSCNYWAYVPQLERSLRAATKDFPVDPVVKNLLANAEDTGSIPSPESFHMAQGN